MKVVGSGIGGSIQIVQGGGAYLARNAVNGDIQLFENNRALWVARNRVNGNLQCKKNRLRPRDGGNLVQGNKEYECRRL